MAVDLLMPKLGLTMQEATIVSWIAADGDHVAAGEPVLTIETDKVETDVDAPGAGILRIHGQPGEVYQCGDLIGWFVEEGEATPEAPAAAATMTPPTAPTGPRPAAPVGGVARRGAGGRLLSSPNARRVAAELGVDLETVSGTGPGGRIVSEDVEAAAAAPASRRPLRTDRVVPFAARAVAEQLGLDVDEVPASAVDGRLTRDDVFAYARHLIATRGEAGPAPGAVPPSGQTPTRRIPLTGMRGTIAERMHSSLREMAQLTLDMDADLAAVVELRGDLARELPTAAVPGYTDFVIAAAARALVAHPLVNSQIHDDHVELLPDVHVGMAVAVDDGLVVPVIDHADRLAVTDLAVETSRLAEAARDRKLTLDEISGGTFSVTALGMFGVSSFTPVINPPNTAILGIGRLRDDTVWDDGTPRPVRRLTLSLTWDHRAFDGAPAADFCRTIARLLEQPRDLLP